MEEKKMTVAEIAGALGYEPETIRKKVKELFPEGVEHGKKTRLTENQVVEIKKNLFPRTPALKSGVENAVTRSEMMAKTAEVIGWLKSEIDIERAGRLEAERKNAVLMHVTKTYTAGEIAKELGMRSAQELNEAMKEAGIQYKQNGTWIPCADYSEQGFFQIKQQELESGKVIYDRRITQDGRRFILEFFTSDGVF